PEQLNFVLVDFKGGATFAGMSDLPHVSAMISNLESELSLVDRMQDALRGEMVRRQEVLRRAGNYANVSDYEEDRVAGKHDFPPLPALVIVLDEFSEMLSAKPEFIDLFVAIGRLGRSLAIHLLLASQRLEEGRLRGLDSHLSYRIGLRTFSAQESRSVLGVPDAYELPSLPGVGYLKAGTERLVRFRASYVAAPPPPRRIDAGSGRVAGAPSAAIRVLPFTAAPVLQREETPSLPESTGEDLLLPGDEQWRDMSEMDIAVARMRGHGRPAHQVGLPPLEEPDTLDSLLADLAVDPRLGLSAQWRARGPLRIPLGTVDLPLEQRRATLEFDLSGAGGHMAVVGGPLSGKSTALRSVVMALSVTHTPREVQFYVMDFGGGTFTPFEGAPHVAGVATRDREDVLNRMLAEIEGILADRERYFRENRIDSISTYRQGRSEGRFDDGYGDVFLVVDGWSTLRSDFEGMDMRIQALLPRALTFGVHLVLSTARWMDLRQQVRDVIGSRLELRLGDPTDSDVDRKIAQLVPTGRPGRGLESGGHHVLVTLPRADGDHEPSSLTQGVGATLERIRAAWPGTPGPKLRLLPTSIDLDTVRQLPGVDHGLALGVEESRLGPLLLDPAQESHLFLLGDSKSGKSTFLRSLAREIMRTHTPSQAQIFAIDLRRSLLDEIPEEYLAGYMTTREDADSKVRDLATYLRTRLPGESVTTEQLRNRSWWSGAEAWLLVDDYDLVATQSGNPVAALQPLMAQARDIGLHIVVARRMGGASRAMFEPVVQTMTELGSTGILLSGSPDEGAVIGRVKPVKSVPGRAQVVSRDAGRVVAQLAWSEPRA
ncbi:MAG: type VII secretion protein EccCb, partial [Actinomyces sp.]|nr:type VII secretion protein EccCb [Actinomyces sp.]